eukprot:1152173-Pelagomonas_calceolata.AAC.1
MGLLGTSADALGSRKRCVLPQREKGFGGACFSARARGCAGELLALTACRRCLRMKCRALHADRPKARTHSTVNHQGGVCVCVQFLVLCDADSSSCAGLLSDCVCKRGVQCIIVCGAALVLMPNGKGIVPRPLRVPACMCGKGQLAGDFGVSSGVGLFLPDMPLSRSAPIRLSNYKYATGTYSRFTQMPRHIQEKVPRLGYT